MDESAWNNVDGDQEELVRIENEAMKNRKRNDGICEALERADEALFWDYHYSARAFITDINSKAWFKKRYDVSTVFLSFLMKDQGVHDHDFERVAREMVIAYNAYYNKNPKFSYATIPGEMKNLYKINELTRDESRAARFFLYVSFKYGYTFTSKIYPHQIQKQIIEVAKGTGGVPSVCDIKGKQFIKYDGGSLNDVRFNYVDKCGIYFFENESVDKLYLYIDCDAWDSSSHIENISASISAWKKKINLNYYTKGDRSSIQVVVSEDVIHREKSSRSFAKKLVKKISDAVASYSVWMGGSKLVDSSQSAGIVKHIYVPRHEQLPNGARAIGLWLWDMVHFDQIYQAEAIRRILDAPFPHCRQGASEIALQKDYALAARCIKRRAVLKLTDRS